MKKVDMFQILRISSGWIMGEMQDDSLKHFFDYSYINDFVNDLMLALIYAHSDLTDDGPNNSFAAHLEPATDIWELECENDSLHVVIKSYKDFESKKLETVKEFHFDYFEFLNSFLEAMTCILKKYGLLGYRESWSYEFPVSLYLKLIDIYNSSNDMKFHIVSEKDNLGAEAVKTDIQLEMKILESRLKS